MKIKLKASSQIHHKPYYLYRRITSKGQTGDTVFLKSHTEKRKRERKCSLCAGPGTLLVARAMVPSRAWGVGLAALYEDGEFGGNKSMTLNNTYKYIHTYI